MVLPPNRVGGIRGPNGATLDDVVQVLAFIATKLSEMQLTLEANTAHAAQTRAAVERLSGLAGTDAAWPGLPAYLNAVLGDYVAVAGVLDTVHGYTFDAAAAAERMLLALFGSAEPSTLDRLAWLLATRNALIAGQGENVFERLGSVRDNTLSTLDAIGPITAAPTGETVRELLLRQAECCEGTGSGPDFLPPANFSCEGENASWQECQLELFFDQGAPDQVVYSVVFPADMINNTVLGARNRSIQPEGVQRGLGLETAQGEEYIYRVCLAWEFSPDTPLYNMAVIEVLDSEDLPAFGYTDFTEQVPNEDTRTTLFEAEQPSGILRVLHVNFAWDSGTVPVGKVWAAVTRIAEF